MVGHVPPAQQAANRQPVQPASHGHGLLSMAAGAWHSIENLVEHEAHVVADAAIKAEHWLEGEAAHLAEEASHVAHDVAHAAHDMEQWVEKEAKWAADLAAKEAHHVAEAARQAEQWAEKEAHHVADAARRAEQWAEKEAHHIAEAARQAEHWMEKEAHLVAEAARQAEHWVEKEAKWAADLAAKEAHHVAEVARHAEQWVEKEAHLVAEAARQAEQWAEKEVKLAADLAAKEAHHLAEVARHTEEWLEKETKWAADLAAKEAHHVAEVARHTEEWVEKEAKWAADLAAKEAHYVAEAARQAEQWGQKQVQWEADVSTLRAELQRMKNENQELRQQVETSRASEAATAQELSLAARDVDALRQALSEISLDEELEDLYDAMEDYEEQEALRKDYHYHLKLQHLEELEALQEARKMEVEWVREGANPLVATGRFFQEKLDGVSLGPLHFHIQRDEPWRRNQVGGRRPQSLPFAHTHSPAASPSSRRSRYPSSQDDDSPRGRRRPSSRAAGSLSSSAPSTPSHSKSKQVRVADDSPGYLTSNSSRSTRGSQRDVRASSGRTATKQRGPQRRDRDW